MSADDTCIEESCSACHNNIWLKNIGSSYVATINIFSSIKTNKILGHIPI